MAAALSGEEKGYHLHRVIDQMNDITRHERADRRSYRCEHDAYKNQQANLPPSSPQLDRMEHSKQCADDYDSADNAEGARDDGIKVAAKQGFLNQWRHKNRSKHIHKDRRA